MRFALLLALLSLAPGCVSPSTLATADSPGPIR